MAGLEGTIKTPVGEVSKKTALYMGAGVTALAAYVWYRHRQLGTSTSTSSTDTSGTEIDPATGFAYGSAEDLAALAAQGNTTVPTEGGSSSVPVNNVGFTSNGQWSQAVIAYMTSNGLVSDSTALTAALGKYTTGAYIAVGSTDDSLVEQAIAVEGYPPVSGIGGYPPSINRNPPTGTTTPPSGSTSVGSISGRVTKAARTSITTSFKGATGAVRYEVTLNGSHWNDVSGSPFTINGLKANTSYTIGIRAVSSDGHLGPVSNTTIRTLK